MANLRVNKITGTEVFETTGSVQFDGTTDFLTISSNTDFAMGTGDFTAECWIYLRGYSDAEGGYSERVFDSNTGQLGIYITSDGTGYVGALVGGTDIRSSTAPDLQSWSHLAISRSGTTFRIFLNGIQILSRENSSSVASSGNFLIGARASGEGGFRGHISNFRILKGTALYTKNFTPPTRELTVIPNTVLLACTSTTRANDEKTGKTITVNGNATASELTPGLLTSVVKSGGSSAISGSVEFDGDGDFLRIPNTVDFDFATGNFTIEMWFYQTSNASRQDLTGNYVGSTNGWGVGTNYDNTNDIIFYHGNTVIINTSTIYSLNTWNHLSISRDSQTLRLFMNGNLITSVSDTTNISSTRDLRIGGAPTVTDTFQLPFNGFISNLRIIKGTALYTQNFIPPTRELKKIPGTVLLCCQSSTNPLQEATGKTISLNGSVTTYSVGIGTTTPNPRNFTPQVGSDGSVTFDGVTKINTPNYFYLPIGNTEDRGRGRGLFGGGEVPGGNTNVIDYIQIQSQGIAQDFGDLTAAKRFAVSCSSSTRGVFGGGATPAATNVLEYVTISTTSNVIDFGDLAQQAANDRQGACSNSTRGLWAGNGSFSNVIQYITIASTGNSNDFGDLTVGRFGMASFASPTRGIFAGGATPTFQNIIDYVTIASTGNALTFGNITSSALREPCGCSNGVRGVFGGGQTPGSPTNIIVNIIEYITIASTGNGTDFGDLTQARTEVYGSTSNSIRGVWGGGQSPSLVNTIDYVTIASTGNAQDFGDLTVARNGTGACSDSHGGLG